MPYSLNGFSVYSVAPYSFTCTHKKSAALSASRSDKAFGVTREIEMTESPRKCVGIPIAIQFLIYQSPNFCQRRSLLKRFFNMSKMRVSNYTLFFIGK